MNKIKNILYLLLKIITIIWTIFFALLFFIDNDSTKSTWLVLIFLGLALFLCCKKALNIKKEVFNSIDSKTDVSDKKEPEIKSIKEELYGENIPILKNNSICFHEYERSIFFKLSEKDYSTALQYINNINCIIFETSEHLDRPNIFEEMYIDLKNINFDYPIERYDGCFPCSYVEYSPYTKTGKPSKYPVKLHFESKYSTQNKYGLTQYTQALGEIKLLKDGNIGSAVVSFIEEGLKIEIGLYGVSLAVKKATLIKDNRILYKLDK